MSRSPSLGPDEFQQLLEQTQGELRAALAQEELDTDHLCQLITKLNALRFLIEHPKEKAS